MDTNLFVYGTLRPGQTLWPMLEPCMTGDPVCVIAHGYLLLDSGHNYPIMVKSSLPNDTVRGTLLQIDAKSQAFTRICAMEIGAGYDMEVVETNGGEAMTFTYHRDQTVMQWMAEGRFIPYRKIAGYRIFDFSLYRERLGYPPNQSALLEK